MSNTNSCMFWRSRNEDMSMPLLSHLCRCPRSKNRACKMCPCPARNRQAQCHSLRRSTSTPEGSQNCVASYSIPFRPIVGPAAIRRRSRPCLGWGFGSCRLWRLDYDSRKLHYRKPRAKNGNMCWVCNDVSTLVWLTQVNHALESDSRLALPC